MRNLTLTAIDVATGADRALSHNCGICIRVVSGGVLTVGDAVVILDTK